MCGIFGYAGIASEHEKLFNFLCKLAHESEVRGTHSTGFSARLSSGKLISDKMPYRGSVFCQMSSRFNSLAEDCPPAFIGHTRYGTGSDPKINNNNHPFYGKYFHMVHNGVIPGWEDYADKYKIRESMTSETDSEIIIRFIESLKSGGTKTKVEKLLNSVWGNMAVALIEKSNDSIWLFRNYNPLYVMTVDAGVFGPDTFLFFVSTGEIFRNAWKAASLPEGKYTASFLDKNKLYKIGNKYSKCSDGYYKFTYWDMVVKKPFQKSYQYSNDYIDYYPSTTKKYREKYWSKASTNNPADGLSFSDKEVTDIFSAMSNNDNDVLIDGLPQIVFKELIELNGLAKSYSPNILEHIE